jgi:hypothetical protein
MFLLDLGVLFFRSCFGRHWSGLGCRLDFLHALFFAIQFHSCAARSRSSRSLLLCVAVFFDFRCRFLSTFPALLVGQAPFFIDMRVAGLGFSASRSQV